MQTVSKTTNWLTEGLTKEELNIQKTLAIIAAELQFKRIDMGLDQKEFAKKLGVSQGLVSRWESGTYNFTITTLANICNKLGLLFEPRITDKEIETNIDREHFESKLIVVDCSYDNGNYSNWKPKREITQSFADGKAGEVA